MMCATCGCDGDKAVMLNLQSGETTTIDARHQHQSHVGHSNTHDHIHGVDDHAHHHIHGVHDHPHHHHGPHKHSTSDHLHQAEANGHKHSRCGDAGSCQERCASGEEPGVVHGPRDSRAQPRQFAGSRQDTLLERTIRDLAGELPLYVIEGDQATANDGERIRKAGGSVVQINTGTGCHLDADMVTRALSALKPADGAVVLIENVGNLVCPALFDLGERAKVVIFSVTDGEDKPLSTRTCSATPRS
jgi:hydrogenase nickel incorporation protein HypB